MNARISQMLGGKEQIEEILSEAAFRSRCSIPCIVQSYNSENETVECQPAIREELLNEDNTTKLVNLPLLINVPVAFPHTGSYGFKFPIQKGDEVLVIFQDLAIDNFWLKGNVQNPVENRRHDLSDGIAIPTSLSLPSKEITSITQIVATSSDLTFKTPSGSTSINTLLSEIQSLKDRLSSVEGRLNTAEGKIASLESHYHQVQVGEDVYNTGGPLY